MLWSEIRQAYPNQWLVIEALKAHTTPDNHRHLDRLSVIEVCPDGSSAMRGCRTLWCSPWLGFRVLPKIPAARIYFVNTNRPDLEIRERRWLGIRGDHGTAACVARFRDC